MDLPFLCRTGHAVDHAVSAGHIQVQRGRHHAVADRHGREYRLNSTGGAEQMAGGGLGGRHRQPLCRCPEQALHGGQLDVVAGGRGSAVGVDIADIAWRNPGAAQCVAHGAEGAVPGFVGRGDMPGIARHAVASQLGMDPGAAGARMLQRFQHHHPRPLAHHKPVAVAVPWAGGTVRRVVEAGGKGTGGGEAGHAEFGHGRLGAARQHHIGIAERDRARRVTDGMRARGAGRGNGAAWAMKAEMPGQVGGDVMDHAAQHEAAVDTAGQAGTLAQGLQRAAAGADGNASHGMRLRRSGMPAGIPHRLRRSDLRQAPGAVCPARLGAGGPGGSPHLPGNAAGKLGVEVGDGPNARPAIHQAAPHRLKPVAERTDDAHSCDDNAAHVDSLLSGTLQESVGTKRGGVKLA